MNPATQKQALTAGARTFLQTFRASLLVVTAGGGILGAIHSLGDIQWAALGAAIGAGAVVSFFAGLDSYLDFTIKGIPVTYTDPTTPVTVVAPAPVVVADPTVGTGD